MRNAGVLRTADNTYIRRVSKKTMTTLFSITQSKMNRL